MMSGSAEDMQHAKSLQGKIPGDFIWFERDEKSYIIRDQATVDRAKQLWAGRGISQSSRKLSGKSRRSSGRKCASRSSRK